MNEEISNKLALLVIDMQPPFINSVAAPEQLVKRVNFAIEAAQLFGIKLILTEQIPEKLGPTKTEIEALAPDAKKFSKSSFSINGADGFNDYLEEEGIEHLLVTGIEIPICVYQSCIDLISIDQAVTVLSDCVSGRRPEDFDPIRRTLTEAGCHWLPSESIFYSILDGADHPDFKAFTKLVKKYNQK